MWGFDFGRLCDRVSDNLTYLIYRSQKLDAHGDPTTLAYPTSRPEKWVGGKRAVSRKRAKGIVNYLLLRECRRHGYQHGCEHGED